jgi:hypothetical protein
VALRQWEKVVVPCFDGRSRFSNRVRLDLVGDENSYVLPNPEWWLRNVYEASTDPKLRKKVGKFLRGERQLTEDARARLSAKFEEVRRLGRAPGDLWFSNVTSVTPNGTCLTLDLEVDDNHTYIANGMVTHNTRRGASMGVLRVDHPDISEFISCKSEQTELNGFNISVGITDEFMNAVIEGKPTFDLINPRTGLPMRQVDPRKLMDEIVTNAHHNGEPGVLFLDAMNRRNPLPHLYEIEATNPCGSYITLCP